MGDPFGFGLLFNPVFLIIVGIVVWIYKRNNKPTKEEEEATKQEYLEYKEKVEKALKKQQEYDKRIENERQGKFFVSNKYYVNKSCYNYINK